MRRLRRRFGRLILLAGWLVTLAAGCSGQPSAVQSPAATGDCPAATDPAEICRPGSLMSPTDTPLAQAGPPEADPAATPTTTTAPIPSPTLSPVPAVTPQLPTPTACPPELCIYAAQYFLQRPIAAPGNDNWDLTYRFGSTQSGLREAHHGVEFLNAYGTPVLAAGDGLVVVAGGDKDYISPQGAWPILFYGPYSNFYGNLVVIEHQVPAGLLAAFPDMPQPLYTLYGHLSEISVQVSETVKAGQPIGKVGQAGIATGPHLHFEVRLGENNYASSRNPELWLAPHLDQNGQPMGGIAGRFIDSFGGNAEMENVVLEHLPDGPESRADLKVTLRTYEEKGLPGLPPWLESFGVGDLPAGLYRISYPNFGVQQRLVQVLPGQLTVVVFKLE